MRQVRFGAGIAVGILALSAARAGGFDDDATRLARWHDVRGAIFGPGAVAPGDALVRIDAPVRALDAALVPIALSMPQPDRITAIDLVIDDNPAPHAAHLVFGPAADRSLLTLRVRIDGYTNVHAVARLTDGSLVESARFVKASGGCSAPIGVTDEQAMAGMGEIRVKFAPGPVPARRGMATTLMIRHPNFSGMQMNQLTRLYTPAHYVKTVSVAQGKQVVFTLDGDISLATDPVIGFGFVPQGTAPLDIVVTDNQGGSWRKSVPVPPMAG